MEIPICPTLPWVPTEKVLEKRAYALVVFALLGHVTRPAVILHVLEGRTP